MNAQPLQRLCIVTPAHSSLVTGGSEYQIDCLLGTLIPLQRYEIYYLTSMVSGYPHIDAYRIVRIGQARAPRFGYLTYAVPLYRALLRLRPDVIYQRVACGYSGVAAYYARRHGARFVWHVAHDSDVLPEGSLDGRNPVRRYLEKRSVEYAIKRASRIVTQTAHQAHLLQRHYQRTAAAIIPNFQPPPQERPDKSGPLTVVWVASLKPWKQPEAFLRLASALSDLPEVRFLMAGPLAAAAERTWMQSLRRRMQATPNVEYLGALSQREVNELLARAHVFVNTSLHEGFPNTFIQAWARDTAVVSLHVDPDGLLEQDGVGVFCHGSEQQLIEAVRALVTNSARRVAYAGRGRRHAEAKHSLANAAALARLLDVDGAAA
ncbi:MAG: glycosyltransferase family 4 protein [Steroidobacteraceae bacterium]